jgi:polysaccharide chain length determinant protein (PEP-CTERM system associated)
MSLSFEQNLKILVADAIAQRRKIFFAFVGIVALALLIGSVWPQTYQSSATIIVDERNIIQPLMQGAAYPTQVVDTAKIAQEIMHSRKIMNQVADHAGWADAKTSAVARERIMARLRKQTKVTNEGGNLIGVTYEDSDPERAFKTTKKLVDLFIAETAGSKMRESQSAFTFIDAQVKEYQAKLKSTEERLKEARDGAINPRASGEPAGLSRMDSLQATLQQTSSDLKEATMKKASLEKQLAGETKSAQAFARERGMRTRLAEHQARLDTLRMTYQDTYPDIVRLKSEIAEMKKSLAQQEAGRPEHAGAATYVDEQSASAIYQQLRQELSQTETQIQTLQARMDDTAKLLEVERERNRKLYGGATLAELMRNYEVNQTILDDLLKRRESARVSMSLDRDSHGLSFRIHDEASMPAAPSGPAMMQFAIGGLLLGVLMPLGLLYALNQMDTRVRSDSVISDKLKLPVAGVVPHLSTPKETLAISRSLQWVGVLVGSVVFIVISIIWSGNSL